MRNEGAKKREDSRWEVGMVAAFIRKQLGSEEGWVVRWVDGCMGGAKGEGGGEWRKKKDGVNVYFSFVLKKKKCMHVQEQEYIKYEWSRVESNESPVE